jgi:AGZA family xanthine/uracil permease-like MFS transporter
MSLPWARHTPHDRAPCAGQKDNRTMVTDRIPRVPRDTTPGRRTPGAIDRYFGISDRESTFGREVRGGFATFFAMSYIVVLNPLIIGTVADADGNLLGGAGSVPESIAMVGSVTSLAAGLLTILMGVVGKYPFAIAVGLGLNSFLAVSVASQMSWQEAMGLVLIEGVVITLLVITKVRVAVLHAIPSDLKTAMSVGIGLFIAFIGLVDSGFIRRIPDEAGTTVPVNLGIGGPSSCS